ncbi:hypothetical protein XarbCFBP8130_15480 [Xanthomonas arboricola]|nr:hypothetical protein XarbCFBP8153_00475 [Xanthomonas arboricola]PPT62454.1 hypothetical protein XarbCFBP8130_15480 [Xanthomonas arboricola]
MALCKTRLHGSTPYGLRLLRLRGGRRKHRRHRGGCFELQGVLRWMHCRTFGIGVACGLCEPRLHRRWRRMRRQCTQQCGKAIAAGDKPFEGLAHRVASRLRRNFANA